MSKLRRPHKIHSQSDTRTYSALSKFVQRSQTRRLLGRFIRCLFLILRSNLCFTSTEIYQICSTMEWCTQCSKGTHFTLNMLYTNFSRYETKSNYLANISKLTQFCLSSQNMSTKSLCTFSTVSAYTMVIIWSFWVAFIQFPAFHLFR